MDPQKITDLANLLRNNGDKVLNSEFKLTVTGALLRALNDSFTLIADSSELGSTQTFQVVKPNNSKSNVFRDLQLVHDFVQKTVLLCITHYPGDDYFDGVIDISKFRSLKRLEVQKTNGALLRALNDSFTLIADSSELGSTQTFQVVKPNNSKSNVFRDLQLVHDFVQKTVLLCITHYPGDDYFDGVIDISKFRSLKRLEVQKTNVKQIIGIQPLRSQIQQLICTRSLKSVVDIITHCGGDNSNGFVWNELKVADFSYNNLQTVDSSLEFAQYLQHLNLRHNQLVSVEAIKWLPNIKTLDLSFNRLTIVPNLHMETSKRLQLLNLSNNFIEDLVGISKLESLTDLDLSDNCLLDHNYLYPLSALINLKYLNLYGNPLYCHPKHRLAASQFLHKNTSTVKFILDYEPLSKSEKALTGTHQHNNHSAFAARHMKSSSSRSTPGRQTSSSNTPASSVGSTRSFQLNGEDEGIDMNNSITEKSRRSKVRTVDIENLVHTTKEATSSTTEKQLKPTIEANQEHLETKKQIETLREKYGAGWLQNENAQMVHSVLGLSPSKGPAMNSDNKMTTQQILDDFLGEIGVGRDDDTIMRTSTPMNDSAIDETSSEMDQSTKRDDKDTVYESAMSDPENQTIYQSVNSDATAKEDSEEPIDTAPHLKDIYASTEDEPEFSEPEEDEETYIVYTVDKNEAIFLTVSANYIREKDTSNQKTKNKWSLKILESCDRMKSNTLRINFDTIKADKQERVYTVEEGLCQELEKKLRAILSKRDLSEMNQKIYRCINCSCQFSQERTLNNYRKRDVTCPDCKSSFVAEIHSLPKSLDKGPFTPPIAVLEPAVAAIEIGLADDAKPATPPQREEKRESSGEPESSMHSSIGKGPSRLTANNKLSRSLMQSLNQSSVNSLNESSSCSKISNSQSSCDSNQSVAGSSATDRDNDFKSNCESDVDIISNPSQSSIEVLDVQSSRKNSDDRRISQTPNLETIDDSLSNVVDQEDDSGAKQLKDGGEHEKKTSLGHVQLTESSSSGSVTDSVCTSYEQGDKTPTKGHTEVDDIAKRVQPLTEESTKKEESMLSSMFGGLLQSTNMLMSRTTQRFIESESTPSKCEKYKFNYTDFSDVDHRLKFYFYQTKFEEEGEHFKWIVKGKIYNENSGTLSDGIVVMSTVKCYVMEAFAPENDNVTKWLRPIVSVTVDRLESIQILPWKVGLAFTLRDWGGFLLLLQDILRTDSLLFYFSSNALPNQCKLNYQPSEKVLNRLTSTVDEEQLKMFSLLNVCEIKSEEKTVQTFPVSGLFTTDTRVYLTASNPSWLTQYSDAPMELGLTQYMSNLVDVERPDDNIFAINFLDDTQNKSELWKCTFETRENAESCLNAIGQSWEKLFGVPLLNN